MFLAFLFNKLVVIGCHSNCFKVLLKVMEILFPKLNRICAFHLRSQLDIKMSLLNDPCSMQYAGKTWHMTYLCAKCGKAEGSKNINTYVWI